ncbi:Protein kinase domain [Macleaya cordata]|uniref:Protein kinase domain n=1 Tax=Macleaya cordata TaxID=56857 RepID=A0A200Q5A5_MACCD|nr:Protein kinase domain [Macleaya cordata]
MHPQYQYRHQLLSSFPPLIFIFLLIFLIHINNLMIIFSSAQDDHERYKSCSRPFECGDFTASYPFWGQDRPEYCGHPDFKLDCIKNIPSINDTASQRYSILSMNNETQILNIALMDILEGICPAQSSSSSSSSNFISNFPLLEFTSASQNLTLLYGCTLNLQSLMQGAVFNFTCSVNRVPRDLYITGFVGPITPGIESMGNCNKDSVVVPVLKTAAAEFWRNPSNEGVGGVVRKGFEVRWIMDDTPCRRCVHSGGQCGYTDPSNPFICFCSNGRRSETSCPPSGSAASPPTSISAGFVVILLLCSSFLIYRRRRSNKLLLISSSSPILLSKNTSSSKTNSKINMDYEKGSSNFSGVQIFTYTELQEATNNFDASKELGDGGFGTVYYGILKDGRQVAVKRLFENNYKRVEQFMNEVEILTMLRHQNLVTLYGSTSHNSRELLLVYEFIANGTVADHLHGARAKPGQLNWPSRMNIAMESASALTYLHASDIIHRDVKTTNILLDKYFGVKVADFGLSRLFPTNVTHVSTAPQGTPGYVDPEYYQCYQLTDKSDVYSFGVVLIELISSKPAVDTNRHRYEINLASMAINKIRNGELHEMVDPNLGFETDQVVRRMIISVAELAFRCLQQQREMRPSMVEVLEVLKGIKSEVYTVENAEVVDIPADDIGLLDDIPMISPDSTTTTSKDTITLEQAKSAIFSDEKFEEAEEKHDKSLGLFVQGGKKSGSGGAVGRAVGAGRVDRAGGAIARVAKEWKPVMKSTKVAEKEILKKEDVAQTYAVFEICKLKDDDDVIVDDDAHVIPKMESNLGVTQCG